MQIDWKKETVYALVMHVPHQTLRQVYSALEPRDHSTVLDLWDTTDFAEAIVERARR